MVVDKLKWCFRIKEGLKFAEPSERLAKSYLGEAKSSLKTAEKNFQEGDLLWTTVVIYYAEYYAMYAFLQRVGIKCENHFCSILAVTKMLGDEKTIIINKHKEKRVDAQYYMKIEKEEQINNMLRESKVFVNMFDEIVSNISENEINNYRKTLKTSFLL
ncbi:MAG: hypothetical protein AABW45_03655 [Nanoarchaeota archaeon]